MNWMFGIWHCQPKQPALGHISVISAPSVLPFPPVAEGKQQWASAPEWLCGLSCADSGQEMQAGEPVDSQKCVKMVKCDGKVGISLH